MMPVMALPMILCPAICITGLPVQQSLVALADLGNQTALRSQFLDDFLLNRIGCQVLLGHYLACRAGQRMQRQHLGKCKSPIKPGLATGITDMLAQTSGSVPDAVARNGIIDTRCDTRRVCRAAAEAGLYGGAWRIHVVGRAVFCAVPVL